ncbi:unnamed protein product, partial [Discosporangium mesarthrocarpum]
LDEDGTATLDIDEFTSAMARLVSTRPDEATLARARRAALGEAFRAADTDGSGELDVAEVTRLLERLETRQTQSELVDKFMELADVNQSGTVDEEEFLRLAEG